MNPFIIEESKRPQFLKPVEVQAPVQCRIKVGDIIDVIKQENTWEKYVFRLNNSIECIHKESHLCKQLSSWPDGTCLLVVGVGFQCEIRDGRSFRFNVFRFRPI